MLSISTVVFIALGSVSGDGWGKALEARGAEAVSGKVRHPLPPSRSASVASCDLCGNDRDGVPSAEKHDGLMLLVPVGWM